jgi:hypothetical protein
VKASPYRAYIVVAMVFIVCIATTVALHAADKRNLGLLGIRNKNGTWLRVSDNVRLRVDPKREAQATWFLIAVDRSHHVYAFANYQTGKFLAKGGSAGCVVANAFKLTTAAEWRVIHGAPAVDAVALRNVADGTLLAENGGSGNEFVTDACAGPREVFAKDSAMAAGERRGWGGWWDLRIVDKQIGDPGTNSILGEPVTIAPVPVRVITSL